MNTTLFNILWFSCQGTSRDIVYQRSCWFSWLIFVQHGLYGILLTLYSALSRLTAWSRNLLHNPMQNMADNNISYIIYPLSTRIEKGYTTKMIPFLFCSVYLATNTHHTTWIRGIYFRFERNFARPKPIGSLKKPKSWKGYYNNSVEIVPP